LAISTEDAIALFASERDRIWLSPPEEITVLSKGTNPRGIGSRGQYLTPIMFAEGAARSLADETLWEIMALCDRDGTDLTTLKAVVTGMVGRKAGFFELFGLPHISEMIGIYVSVAETVQDTAELRRLTVAMVSYVNRVHVWIDAAFPWGVCSGFMRPVQERRP
jgi:hypothetical protein